MVSDVGQSGQPDYAFLYSRKCERASGDFQMHDGLRVAEVI